jgi:uncharacterized damage-inducible protein DinB
MTRLFLPLALFIALLTPTFASAAAHKEGELDKEVASILKIYEHAHGNINKYVEGLTDEQVNFVAEINGNKFNNSIAWLAHHIIGAEMFFLSQVTGEEHEIELFDENNAKAEDVKAAFLKSYETFKSAIKKLKAEDLTADGFKMGEDQMTKAETIHFNIWHLTHHGGHMVVLRRLQGITKE